MVDTKSDNEFEDDATVLRDDATVMRGDTESSLGTFSASTGHDPSWRSGTTVGDAEAPRVLKQRFVLEDRLGSGGMGTVFKAKDLRKVEARDAQPYVAIKVLNNDFRKHPEAFIALEREASKSQTLRHPNVVSIFDFDKDEDVPYITMELLEGIELSHMLRQNGGEIERDQGWQIISDMVQGLAHAHDQGVVHADLKPSNIFVSDDGSAKILDFGIARAMRSNQPGEQTRFDPARLAALTPAYASREMLNGDSPEPRDDLYALGVVIYMVLAGHHPYGRLPANEAVQEGLKAERPRGITQRQWATLRKCLAFNRQERPDSASAVFDGLFGKPAWQSFSIAASVAILAVAGIVAATYEPPDVAEVRAEVKQQTLVEAQIDRIDTLLNTPLFDGYWEDELLSEVDRLRHLDFMNDDNGRVIKSVSDIFIQYVENVDDLSAVAAVYSRAKTFGGLEEVELAFHDRLVDELRLLAKEPLNLFWTERAQQRLDMAKSYFPDSPGLQVVRVELADHVNKNVNELVSVGDTKLAANAWELFGNELADEKVRVATEKIVVTAVQKDSAAEERRREQRERKRLISSLDQHLNVSCLRIDVPGLATELRSMQRQYPEHKRALHKQTQKRLDECGARLELLDEERSAEFERVVQTELAFVVGRAERLDPCLKGDTCTDALSEKGSSGEAGPKLVVVDGEGERFAITQHEISWRDFALYCESSNECEATSSSSLPVAGIELGAIERYADWLSERTGQLYRLPTLDEWFAIAIDQPDPNRNCRVEVGGVRRGDSALEVENGNPNSLGLVHVLGNVGEIVVGDDGYTVVGGGFRDPIEECVALNAKALEKPDAQTGFRLVREVS